MCHTLHWSTVIVLTSDLRQPDLRANTLDLTALRLRGFADPFPARDPRDPPVSRALRLRSRQRHRPPTAQRLWPALASLKDCGRAVSRQVGRYVSYRLAGPAGEVVPGSAEKIPGQLASQIAACVNDTALDGSALTRDATP